MSYSFLMCTKCGTFPESGTTEQACTTCNKDSVRQYFTPDGPYSNEEFAEFMSRKSTIIARDPLPPVINRLVATIADRFRGD